MSTIAFPPGPTPRVRRRQLWVLAGAAVTALLALALAVALSAPYALLLLGVADLTLVVVATHRFFLRWHVLASTILLCILLIPLGRYQLPGSLPFAIEPYRVLVAAVALAWLTSTLIQRDTRWRSSGLFPPLAGLVMAMIVSVAANAGKLQDAAIQANVIKQLSMFASFIVVLLFVSNIVKSRYHLDVLLKALTGGGGVVGFFAIVQYRTGYNIFDHLHQFFPILKVDAAGTVRALESRGSADRVYASAQHPIALSAALVMLLPIGAFTAARFGKKRWWIATAMIGMASLSSVARTGMLMLVVELLTLLCIKPRPVLRLWPWAIPFLILAHLAAPGALGSLKNSFLPQGGLIAEQQAGAGKVSSNRLADFGPALDQWWKEPAFGQGFGSRITDVYDPSNNALILDDQWLGMLLETGAAGFISLLWLFGRSIRPLGRAARRDPTSYGWLPACLAASLTGFAVGMLTFDAFSFLQVTFLAFALIGISVAARRLGSVEPAAVAAPA